MFGLLSRRFLIYLEYSALSDCARKALTAGPFDEFKIFICRYVASVTSPITPPNASISLTNVDFAGPPTAGLQGCNAILSRLSVQSNTFIPSFAHARVASQPACPAPTIIMSNLLFR